MGIYFLGLKSSTVKHTNFFDGYVLLEDVERAKYSYYGIYKKQIDYNALENFVPICDFYSLVISKILKEDKDAEFMIYNQAATEHIKDLSHFVCINDFHLIKTINNKPECRKILAKEANCLQYKFLKGKEITYKKASELFGCKNKKFVVQQPIGFAGIGTFLLTEQNEKQICSQLEKECEYSISVCIEKALSLNNTFMISDNYIQIFQGSLQKIKIDNEFNYDGWDFEGYEKLDKELKIKIFNQTYGIAEKLQQMGYRGIGGIDYIEKDGEVYFMEVNPRFQTSSQELDNILIQNKFPSIFELNYLCFKNEKKFIEICEKIAKKLK